MKFEFSLSRNTKLKSLNMVINSNDRLHPQVKAKMTRHIRNLALYQVTSEMPRKHVPFSRKRPCEVTVTVFSPTKSKLDPPNLYPTVKAIVDGMTDAGIWIDDNHKVIKSMTFRYGGLSGEKGYYKLVLDIREVMSNAN